MGAIFGLLLIVGAVIRYWWVLAAIVGAYYALKYVRTFQLAYRMSEAAEAKRLAGLRARADQQHAWIMPGTSVVCRRGRLEQGAGQLHCGPGAAARRPPDRRGRQPRPHQPRRGRHAEVGENRPPRRRRHIRSLKSRTRIRAATVACGGPNFCRIFHGSRPGPLGSILDWIIPP